MSKLNAPKNHPQQVAKRGGQNSSLFQAGQSSTDEVDTRVTDDKLFRVLDQEFHFTIDVAASVENTKCERYFDRNSDGLIQSWYGEVVWCNPPYSQIAPWVIKTWAEYSVGATVVMLLPANRCEQKWWQEYIEPFRDRGRGIETRFLAGRQAFHDPKLKSSGHMPFGAVIVVFRGALLLEQGET